MKLRLKRFGYEQLQLHLKHFEQGKQQGMFALLILLVQELEQQPWHFLDEEAQLDRCYGGRHFGKPRRLLAGQFPKILFIWFCQLGLLI